MSIAVAVDIQRREGFDRMSGFAISFTWYI